MSERWHVLAPLSESSDLARQGTRGHSEAQTLRQSTYASERLLNEKLTECDIGRIEIALR